MKFRTMLATSIALHVSAAHAAPGTFKAPGGLDPTNMVTVGGAPQQLGTIAGWAYQAIPTASINAASGVAGLDGIGNVTSPVKTPQIATQQVVTNPDGSTVTQPRDLFVNVGNQYFTQGAEAAIFGGLYTAGGTAMHRSLYVSGEPFGNFGAGCTLCIASSDSGVWGGGAQPAIGGIDYHLGAQAAAQSDYAAVGFYHADNDWSARVTAQVASYSAEGLTLVNPMTDEQMASLHDGMAIITNSIDPTASTTSSSGLLQMTPYAGYIKSWDATHIYVYGWAIPSNTASGQVPGTTYDSTVSTYTVPMVWIGVPKKNFAENVYTTADGSKVLGNAATSIVNAYEREEYDWRGSNWSKPGSVSFHGWTTSFQCTNCDPNAFDENSYAYFVNGPGGLPIAYSASMDPYALEFKGSNFWAGSWGEPPNGVGSNHIMGSFMGVPSGGGNIYLSALNYQHDTSTGWTSSEIRLGMNISGTRDRKNGLTGGSDGGQVIFNRLGYPYGVSLCTNNDSSCLDMDGSGNGWFGKDEHVAGTIHADGGSVAFPKNLAINETSNNSLLGLALPYMQFWQYADAYHLDVPQGDIASTNASGTNIVAGSGNDHSWLTYTGGHYIWNETTSGTTVNDLLDVSDQQVKTYAPVSAPGYSETLTTPASSSAPCTAGQFTDDANYHYVCVATNTWKRAALSSF